MDPCMVTRQVKSLRKALHLTQEELAFRCNRLSPRIIVNIERFGYVPSLKVQKRIAKALGVKVRELWPILDDD
jgi:DNA-binding XRE family transcriptional regulator